MRRLSAYLIIGVLVSVRTACLADGIAPSAPSTAALQQLRANFERDGGLEINIPALNKQAYIEIDRAGSTFAQFVSNKRKNGVDATYSYVLRGYARNWLFKSMTEIDRISL